MRIEDAVKALEEGKTIHCPNSFETIRAFDDDLGMKVNCKLVDSETEEQNLYLTRFRILYQYCDFALGPHKSLKKTAKPPETKPAAPDEIK